MNIKTTNQSGGPNMNHVYAMTNGPQLNSNWHDLPYSSLGCFLGKDNTTENFFESNEDVLLDDFRFRKDPIQKCYEAARKDNVFLLQEGGKCFSGFDIVPGGDYMRDGPSSNYCSLDGLGGKSINHVYRITSAPSKVLSFSDLPFTSSFNYSSLGCWFDAALPASKAMRLQEGLDPLLDGNATIRVNAIEKCYQVAMKRGHNVFALQQGACYSSLDNFYPLSSPQQSYFMKYGKSILCPFGGRGTTNINHVYRIRDAPSTAAIPLNSNMSSLFTSLGCFNDAPDPRFTVLRLQERLHARLDGNPQTRASALMKCYQTAVAKRHNVFALQNGGTCLTSYDVINSSSSAYARHGPSTQCPPDGLGHIQVNHVYAVRSPVITSPPEPLNSGGEWATLGCYDTFIRPNIITNMESPSSTNLLDLPAVNRTNPIRKCAQAAYLQWNTVFGITKGGECFSIPNSYYLNTILKIPPKQGCLNDGLGGFDTTQVYEFVWERRFVWNRRPFM